MGFRIIKTAAAATLAIYIAQFLGLTTPLSAGLLAILGVDVTKWRGLKSAAIRIAASVLGLFLAAVVFATIGYPLWAMGLYVLLAYPVLAKTRLQDGIVTSTVVMLHLFGDKSVNTHNITNEVLLLLIGLGTASVINIGYMPNNGQRLEQTKRQVEEKFAAIFQQLAAHLRDHQHVWDGHEYLEAGEAIRLGTFEAARLRENTLFQREESWMLYFEMRQQQLDSIERMLGLVAQVYETLPHGKEAALLFEELSELISQRYYTGKTEEQLGELENRYKRMPLPETRSEFEIRSALRQLLQELQAYLTVAKRLKRQIERDLKL